jgi:SAM-dependent methyltransferase
MLDPLESSEPLAARDPTTRFTDRVDDYRRGRPGYPPALLDLLERCCGLGPHAVVADLGSGTGIFTELLLERGARVYAVEPNAAMAATAEEKLGARPAFTSVGGRAEDTGLAATSVDLVTVAQALHWFDLQATRRELARILRPHGFAAAVWNSRRRDGTPFLRGYEALLERWGTDYGAVGRRGGEEGAARALFGDGVYQRQALEYTQSLDLDSLHARLLSSSYTPAVGDPRRAPMLEELDALFAAHQREGRVTLEYDTEVYWAPRAVLG